MAKTSKQLQAVILAAGESSRFWPFSDHGHKSLFKIADQPIIWHTVQGLIKNGVKEIILVTAPGEQTKFENALKEVKTGIIYVAQSEPLGTGHALKLAKPYLKGDFVVLNGAHIHSEKMVGLLKKARMGKKFGLLTAPAESVERYAMVTFDSKNKKRVVGLVEKPNKEEVVSNIRTVGIYWLPLEFMDYLGELENNPYVLIEALHNLVQDQRFEEVRVEKETSSIKYAFDILNMIVEMTNMLNKKVSRKTKVAKNAWDPLESTCRHASLSIL